MLYCIENMGRIEKAKEAESKLLNFYEKYIQKYISEIVDFNSDIKVNNLDNDHFMGVMNIINNPELYDEDTLSNALNEYDINDGLANFISSGLLKIKDGKFYIDPKKLSQKAIDHKNVKEFTDDCDKKVVSVYTKGPRK